jgi:hypothetical protein
VRTLSQEDTVTKGVKIVIGCVGVLVLAIVATAVGMLAFAYWAKGKVEGVAGDFKKVAQLQEKADKNPFSRPADGIISEARLTKFLEVRKQVYSIYDLHRAEIEAVGKQKQADFSSVTKMAGLVQELRLAHAQGLVDAGMSQAEYAFLVEAVYKSAVADSVARSTNSRTAGEAYDKAKKASKEAMEEGLAEARRNGVEPPEGADKLAGALEGEMGSLPGADVPAENVALFRKHEAEIKKYAMSGLEWIGF